LFFEQFGQGIIGQHDGRVFAVAFHLDGLRLFEDDLHGNLLELFDIFAIDGQNFVAVAQAELVAQTIDRDTVFVDFCGRQIGLAFVGQQTVSPSPINWSPANFIVPARAMVRQSEPFPSSSISGVAVSQTPLLDVDTSEMNIRG
jgi:hypothetical protein